MRYPSPFERFLNRWLVCLPLVLALPVSALEIHDHLVSKGFKRGRAAGEVVDTVVLHFISNVKASPDNPHDPKAAVKLLSNSNASAHYLLDRAGKVYRLVKEEDTAFHAGEGVWRGRTNTLNRFSIGIELLGIGTAEEMKKTLGMKHHEYDAIAPGHLGFTEAQYTALKALLAEIRSRHPKIKFDRDHLIGHDEYARGRKFDPGSLFDWRKLGL